MQPSTYTQMQHAAKAAAFIALLSCMLAGAGNTAALLSFGDSLTDTGNLWVSSKGFVPRADLYPNHQFAQAPGTWAAQFQLGSTPTSKYVYAVAGAPACKDSAVSLQIPSYVQPQTLAGQVGKFVNNLGNITFLKQLATPDTLITTVWSGHVDVKVLFNLYGAGASQDQITTFLKSVSSCVGLATAGLLPLLSGVQLLRPNNLPQQRQVVVIFTYFPLDLNPFVPDTFKPTIKANIDTINAGLTQAATNLAAASAAFGGPRVVLFDVNAVVRNAFANAAALGFTNTASSCITYNDPFDLLAALPASSPVCPDPTNYFYLDPIHASARVHGIIEDAFNTFLAGLGLPTA